MGKTTKLLWGIGAGALSIAALSVLKKKAIPEPKVPTNLEDNIVLFFQRSYSPYCIKVKKIMDYKGIPYKNVDVLPVFHRKFLKDVSGQHLVPVIKYQNDVVNDSTKIAHYLEEIKSEPSIFIKDDEKLNKEVLMLEDWADESFIKPFAKLAVIYNSEHPEIMLETNDYDTGVNLLDKNKDKIFPVMLKFMLKGYGTSIEEKPSLKKLARTNLDILASKLEGKEFLVGDRLTLADIAIASHLETAKKVPYIAEDEQYEAIFKWQEKIMKMTERRLAEAV
ncbi:MAG: glutathione S-transferase family protein [Candidatus Sericytochromatia bacterium]